MITKRVLLHYLYLSFCLFIVGIIQEDKMKCLSMTKVNHHTKQLVLKGRINMLLNLAKKKVDQVNSDIDIK